MPFRLDLSNMQLSNDFMRFPDRRSWYIFLARMAVLLVAAGALLEHGLSQALPGTTGPSAPAPTPIVTPGPELSATLSAGPDATGVLTEDVRVVSDDGCLTGARLRLVAAAKEVLAKTLNLMGMTAPDRM